MCDEPTLDHFRTQAVAIPDSVELQVVLDHLPTQAVAPIHPIPVSVELQVVFQRLAAHELVWAPDLQKISYEESPSSAFHERSRVEFSLEEDQQMASDWYSEVSAHQRLVFSR